MTLSILWLCNSSSAFVASLEEQLQPEGYGLLRPDPLLPAWQLPTAQFAVIEWADDGKTARQQVHLLPGHQPACHLLLLLPNERSVVLQGVLLTAAGYLAAPLSLAELVACLHRIRLGQGYWNPGLLVLLTGTLLTQDAYPSGLNQRERELWDHLANGLANPQIDVLMCLSGSRVKNLKTSLAQKLGLPTAHHLIEQAVAWRKAIL